MVSFRDKRCAYDSAGIIECAKVTKRDGLHEYVANGGCFNGTCDYSTPRAIGSELIQQAVFRPAADDVNGVKMFAA